MVRVIRYEIANMNDDVVFHRPSITLYAAGCKWKCKYCHSKVTWNQQGYYLDLKELYQYLDKFADMFTLVGEGGDFYFQLKDWVRLCNLLKDRYPDLKIIWYTGASLHTIQAIHKRLYDLSSFDAILCGRSYAFLDDKNRKILYYPKEDKYEFKLITSDGYSLDYYDDYYNTKYLLGVR